MCLARASYDGLAELWNQNNPFVKMLADGDVIAKSCTEYKILGSILLDKNEYKLWSWVPGK